MKKLPNKPSKKSTASKRAAKRPAAKKITPTTKKPTVKDAKKQKASMKHSASDKSIIPLAQSIVKGAKKIDQPKSLTTVLPPEKPQQIISVGSLFAPADMSAELKSKGPVTIVKSEKCIMCRNLSSANVEDGQTAIYCGYEPRPQGVIELDAADLPSGCECQLFVLKAGKSLGNKSAQVESEAGYGPGLPVRGLVFVEGQAPDAGVSEAEEQLEDYAFSGNSLVPVEDGKKGQQEVAKLPVSFVDEYNALVAELKVESSKAITKIQTDLANKLREAQERIMADTEEAVLDGPPSVLGMEGEDEDEGIDTDDVPGSEEWIDWLEAEEFEVDEEEDEDEDDFEDDEEDEDSDVDL